MSWTKEKQAAYMKVYREKNREKILQQNKQYYQNNTEKFKQYEQTPQGKKSYTIAKWKCRGLLHDELYEHYLNTQSCNVCNYVFDDLNWRCMDHDHQTGLFRQILCNRCNVMDTWIKKI